ncbi:MAG: ferritin family protein [Sedimentisphaerales bacterium]|nr:ferritin family protein [Sedimentisphaerales bacterium]
METKEGLLKILDFAIREEEKAFEYYRDLAAQVGDKSLRAVMLNFADMERSHKEKLKAIKQDIKEGLKPGDTVYMKLADYTVHGLELESQDSDNPELQKAYLLGIRCEEAAHKLYRDLAKKVKDRPYKKILKSLACEESKHQKRLEEEYAQRFAC